MGGKGTYNFLFAKFNLLFSYIFLQNYIFISLSLLFAQIIFLFSCFLLIFCADVWFLFPIFTEIFTQSINFKLKYLITNIL